MGDRAPTWIAVFCFGGAVLLALCAVLWFVHPPWLNPGWIIVSSACILAAVGLQSQRILRQQQNALTQRQSQAELLAAQLEEQRNAVDALADGLEVAIFICDSRGMILYANLGASRLFRFDDPVRRSILAVSLSYELEQLVVEAHRSAEPQRTEMTFTYPEERIALAKAWTPSDNSSRVFLSVYDITDLRRLERVRRDFVANVSHEFRTPLTIIRAMAETLLDDDEPDKDLLQKYLGKIIGEVDRLSMISQDLLILSTAESNPVRKLACNLADVLELVVQQLAPRAKEKGLELIYEGPGSLVIQANPSQMSQVALNLVENAINYTTTGTVTLTLHEPADDEVRITVSDTGLGIASEHLPRIFERFYRADRARSRNTGGTGLGLSIVKHIVEAHGGTVTVVSSLNRGSTFTVTLPTGWVAEEASA